MRKEVMDGILEGCLVRGRDLEGLEKMVEFMRVAIAEVLEEDAIDNGYVVVKEEIEK